VKRLQPDDHRNRTAAYEVWGRKAETLAFEHGLRPPRHQVYRAAGDEGHDAAHLSETKAVAMRRSSRAM
jgi:hypothetical protein